VFRIHLSPEALHADAERLREGDEQVVPWMGTPWCSTARV
jgi:hypothetical protein